MTAVGQPTSSNVVDLSVPFSIGWASPSEKSALVPLLQSLARQTMNLRIMPTAHLLVLRHGDTPVGWIGTDAQHAAEFPELFSFYLEPSYRNFRLGFGPLLRKLAMQYLRGEGRSHVFVRIEASHNGRMIDFAESQGGGRLVKREALPTEFLHLCTQCELYLKDCQTQAYLELSVDQALEGLTAIAPELTPASLPLRFYLEPSVGEPAAGETRLGAYKLSRIAT